MRALVWKLRLPTFFCFFWIFFFSLHNREKLFLSNKEIVKMTMVLLFFFATLFRKDIASAFIFFFCKRYFYNYQQIYTSGRLAQLVEHWSNKPRVAGSSPVVTIFLIVLKTFFFSSIKKFPVRELNPGLSGESRVSWPPRLTGI